MQHANIGNRYMGRTASSVTRLVGIGLASASLFSLQATASTIAHYRFEEGSPGTALTTATDLVGTSHMNATTPAPLGSSDVPVGVVPNLGTANSRSIDVTNGNRAFATPGGTPLDTTPFLNFTIECWVKFNTIDGYHTMVGRDDTGNPGQSGGGGSLFYLSDLPWTGLRVELLTASKNRININSSFAPAIGVWYHVATVGNSAAGTLTLYVNGISVGETTGFDGLFVPPSGVNVPWTIGRGYWGEWWVDWFDGSIDEVRFSNAALNPEQFLNFDSSGILSFSLQPVPTSGFVGQTLSLNALASGFPSYQWQKSTDNGVTWTDIEGAFAFALPFNPATYDDNGRYRVVATKDGNSITSNAVPLTISYPSPTLVAPPNTSNVLEGLDIVLNGTATGLGNLTYAWSFNENPITGADGPILSLPSITTAEAGNYTVTVTDDAALASGLPATVRIHTITLGVLSANQVTVAYYRFENGADGQTVVTVPDLAGNNDLATQGSPTFTSNVAVPMIARTGAANTLAANFPVSGNNALRTPTTGSLAAAEFRDFTVELYVRNTSRAGWQTMIGRDDDGDPGQGVGAVALFYLQKAEGSNALRVELITRSNVNIQIPSSFIMDADSWYHIAVVGNALNRTLTLYVDGVAVGTNSNFDGLFVPTPGSATAWTIGRGKWANFETDWFRGYLDEVRFSKVALPPSLFLRSSSDSALPPPVVTAAPRHATVRVTDSANFSVAATGQGSLAYQWYHNGNLLNGETSSTLSLTDITTAQAGTYMVTIFDDAGVELGFPPTSATLSATLQVIDTAPPARAISLNFVGAASGSATLSAEIGSMTSADPVGFLSVAGWNNSAAVTGVATSPSPVALNENDGQPSGSLATWFASLTSAAPTAAGVPAAKSADRRLFHGSIETRGQVGSTVTITNVPFVAYDVYVYVAGGPIGNIGAASIDREASPTYYYRLLAHDALNSPTAHLPYMLGAATSISGAQAAPSATFVRFAGISGSDFTITVRDAVNNAAAGGITGISIIDRTPSGAAYPPMIVTTPISQMKRSGSTATFTSAGVATHSGTISYQWQKDGVNLQNQTAATLQLANVTGDSSGVYTVVVTEQSTIGSASIARSASLVVLDDNRRLLISGDINGAGPTFSGNGILRLDGESSADLGVGSTVWNGIAGGAGATTRPLSRESAGLTLPSVTFSYSGSEGVVDDPGTGGIGPSAANALIRDFIFTANQTVPLNASISGLDPFVGKRATLLVYAYGTLSTAFFQNTTSDTATITVAAANNYLGLAPKATTTSDFGGRDLVHNNLDATAGESAAYVSFDVVVGPGGTVAWSLGPDSDGGRIPLVGFQLLITNDDIGPQVPGNLSATASTDQVSLSWLASTGASSYSIKRSATPGGPYQTISAGVVTGTSYVDTSVTGGATYYYVVAAVNALAQSANSDEASATPVSLHTPLQSWRLTHFGTSTNSGNAADLADPDGDGIPNLLEFALGTNPMAPSSLPVTFGQSEGGALTLTFTPVVDSRLSYAIEATSALSTGWTVVHNYGSFTSPAAVTYTDDATGAAQRFLRLKVTSTE
jgi:hypothetical protein